MSLKIKRIVDDLAAPEVDIQLLALTTIPRISPSSEITEAEVATLRARLEAAVRSANTDVIFLARKALNHLGTLANRPAPPAPPAPPKRAVEATSVPGRPANPPVPPKSVPVPVPAPEPALAPVPEPEPLAVEPVPPPEPEPLMVEPVPPPEPEPLTVEPVPPPEPEPLAVAPVPPPEPEPLAVEPAPPPEPEPLAVAPAPPPAPAPAPPAAAPVAPRVSGLAAALRATDQEASTTTAVRPAPAGMSTPERQLLKEADPRRLATILATLAVEAKDPAVLERVVPFLHHEDARVRANAVEVFEVVGGKEHMQFLVPLLGDGNNRVRSNAIKALGKLGHPQTKFYLKQMLDSKEVAMRESAAYALTQIKSLDTLDLLIGLLDDPYEGIRLRAVRALGEFDAPEAVEAVKKHVTDDDVAVREAALEELKKKGVNLTRLVAQEGERAATASEKALEKSVTVAAPAAPDDEPEPLDVKALAAEDNLFHALVQQIGQELKNREQRAHLGRLLFKVGIQGYELCRRSVIKEMPALTAYYEIVKYQEYLQGLTEKVRAGGATGDALSILESGMVQYKNKIRDSFVRLGKLTVDMHRTGTAKLPESKELAAILKLM